MSSPATTREQRLRRTKAQLIDELESLERRATALESAQKGYKSRDRKPPLSDEYLASQELHHLAKFPSENPNPVLRVTPKGEVLYANEAARAAKGLLTGRKKNRLPGELAKVVVDVSRRRGVQEHEFQGKDRVFVLSVTPVAGETYTNIYGRDVTDRKQAEAALRASAEQLKQGEQFLRTVVDTIPAHINIRDAEGRYVLTNRRLADYYGIGPEDAVGRFPDEAFAPSPIDAVEEQEFQQVINTGAAIVDSEYKYGEEGAEEHWLTTRQPIHDDNGQLLYVLTVSFEITERKRAEEALKESEARYRELFEQSPIGIWEQDYSAVKPLIEDLRSQGVRDFRRHFRDHPETLRQAVRAIKELDVNRATLEIYRAANKKEFFAAMNDPKRWKVAKTFWEPELAALAEGLSVFATDFTTKAVDGSDIMVRSIPHINDAHKDTWSWVISTVEDITERKRAEEALRDSRQLLHAVIDAVPAMISAKDRDSRYLFVNRYQAELYGVSRDEAIGKTAGNLLGRKYGAYTRRLDRKVIESGEGLPYFEEDHVDAQGVHRQLLATKVPLKDEQDHVRSVVTVALDITERKQAEEALRENQQLLDTILNHMPALVYLRNAEGRFKLVNRKYEEVHDVDNEKIRGKTLHEVFPKRSADEFASLDAEVLKHHRVQEGEERHWLGEEERTFAVVKFPIIDIAGDVVGVGGVDIDITERKRAEQELAEKEAQLRLALDNMPGGMALEDRDRNYVLLNSQYSELQDYPEGFLKVGMSAREEVRFQVERGDFGPGNKDELVEQVLDLYQGGKATSWERTFPDGRTLRFNVAPTPEGGYATIVTDITERKRAEQELAEKEAQLRLALDNMPGGIMLGDRDLSPVLFNSQYSELYEFPDGLIKVGGSFRDELRYQADRGDFGPGDKDELIEQVVATYQRGEAVSYERVIGGSGRTVQVDLAPTPEGGYVTIATDITERKRAERQLAEAESQLRLALDNMPGGMMLGDRDLNHVLFNAQYSELYEFPDGLVKVGGSIRDELRYQADRGDFGPGDKDDLIEQVVATYQRGEAVSYERVIGGSGRTVQVDLAPTPEGGYVSIATDITELKRAEAGLIEAKRRTDEANQLVTEKNRMLENLSSKLSKYLSPQVYSSIFAGKQSVEIASKRKKLTVFFSDIADFTGTTDSLESEELTNLLNHYLTEMSKIALDYGATIDKYVGDAIIAFFGDPETRGVKEDARTCVNMAIAMQRRMQELQSEWLDMGLERPFQLRIGINTGFCTVGNFGSEDRIDYTIIGNEVNLAARLQSRAEVGGILMAHETHSLVKDTVMAEEGDTITVKGFAKPVRTYSVVGLYDDLAEQGRIIRKDQDGVRVLVDLKKGDKADAIEAIEDVLSQLKG